VGNAHLFYKYRAGKVFWVFKYNAIDNTFDVENNLSSKFAIVHYLMSWHKFIVKLKQNLMQGKI